MKSNQSLTIEMYSEKYASSIHKLILSIQRDEFSIDIDLERQPDLLDISNFYQVKLGNFWIAKLQEQVIGTISLLDIENKQVALRKMFVDKNFRGREYRVGQQLLETVIAHAKKVEIQEIYLGTTEKFLVAQRFYERNEFVEVKKSELPGNFPIMSVDVKFYKLRLQGNPKLAKTT